MKKAGTESLTYLSLFLLSATLHSTSLSPVSIKGQQHSWLKLLANPSLGIHDTELRPAGLLLLPTKNMLRASPQLSYLRTRCLTALWYTMRKT